MAVSFSRSYIVQSVAQASDSRVHVTFFEDNAATDATGAPMGSNTITFTMSLSEGRDFFPGDKITVAIASTPASAPAPAA